jgi:hypothetical protein
MREIRQSGSEGGGALVGSPYPYHKKTRDLSPEGAQQINRLKAVSPLQGSDKAHVVSSQGGALGYIVFAPSGHRSRQPVKLE